MRKVADKNKILKIIKSTGKSYNAGYLKKYCLDELVNTARRRSFAIYEKNELIHAENEPVKEIQCLLYGKVKVTKKTKNGNYGKLQTIKAPDILFLYSMIGVKTHSDTAAAMNEAYVCSIPADEFKKILRNNTTLALGIMKLICTRINKIQKHISKTKFRKN